MLTLDTCPHRRTVQIFDGLEIDPFQLLENFFGGGLIDKSAKRFPMPRLASLCKCSALLSALHVPSLLLVVDATAERTFSCHERSGSLGIAPDGPPLLSAL
jgi:hypothetical protein